LRSGCIRLPGRPSNHAERWLDRGRDRPILERMPGRFPPSSRFSPSGLQLRGPAQATTGTRPSTASRPPARRSTNNPSAYAAATVRTRRQPRKSTMSREGRLPPRHLRELHHPDPRLQVLRGSGAPCTQGVEFTGFRRSDPDHEQRFYRMSSGPTSAHRTRSCESQARCQPRGPRGSRQITTTGSSTGRKFRGQTCSAICPRERAHPGTGDQGPLRVGCGQKPKGDAGRSTRSEPNRKGSTGGRHHDRPVSIFRPYGSLGAPPRPPPIRARATPARRRRSRPCGFLAPLTRDRSAATGRFAVQFART